MRRSRERILVFIAIQLASKLQFATTTIICLRCANYTLTRRADRLLRSHMIWSRQSLRHRQFNRATTLQCRGLWYVAWQTIQQTHWLMLTSELSRPFTHVVTAARKDLWQIKGCFEQAYISFLESVMPRTQTICSNDIGCVELPRIRALNGRVRVHQYHMAHLQRLTVC